MNKRLKFMILLLNILRGLIFLIFTIVLPILANCVTSCGKPSKLEAGASIIVDNRKIDQIKENTSTNTLPTTACPVTLDTLRLKNVYLDANVVKYTLPDENGSIKEYVRLILYDDSIAIAPYVYDNVQKNIYTYSLSQKNRNKIKSMLNLLTVRNADNVRILHEIRMTEFIGSITFYPYKRSKVNTEKYELKDVVDSLYCYLCNLSLNLRKNEAVGSFFNFIPKIEPIQCEEGQREKNISRAADYGSFVVSVEDDQMAIFDIKRQKKVAKLTAADLDSINRIFCEKAYSYSNWRDPQVRRETVISFSIAINGSVVFLSNYPCGYIELDKGCLSVEDEYILSMYHLYDIAKKYFPDLPRDQLQLSNNGKILIYQ